MKSNNTISANLKATAAIIGIVAAGAIAFAALYVALWACYYAGMPM